MKKISALLLGIFLALNFVSCNLFGININISIDFRNRPRKIVDRSIGVERASEPTEKNFISTAPDSGATINGKDFYTDEEIANLLKFEAKEDGIHITYNCPESKKGLKITMFQMFYYDNTGHASTMQILKDDFINDKENFEWVYPLAVENAKMTFQPQINYYDSDAGKFYEFSTFYTLYAKGGIGIIDDLPEDWDSSKYISVKRKKIEVNHIIPVQADERVKYINVFSTPMPVGCVVERWETFCLDLIISEETESGESLNSDDCFVVRLDDLKYTDSDGIINTMPYEDVTSLITYDNIFVTYRYKYTLSDYPYCEFCTPAIESSVMRNVFK